MAEAAGIPALKGGEDVNSPLRQTEAGMDAFRRFIIYLANVREGEIIETFNAALERQGLHLRNEIMTYAEELLAKGEAKGRIQERIQIVQGLIEAGTSWKIIQSATGLTETSFKELKAQETSPQRPAFPPIEEEDGDAEARESWET